MIKLVLASSIAFACATTTSDADSSANAPRPAPRAIACKPSGKVLFQIDHKSTAPGSTTSRFVVDTNGAYTYRAVAPKQPATTARGCLAGPDLHAIEKALATATWKSSLVEAMCDAYSPHYTEYRAGKRLVHTRRVCDGVRLDEATEQSLSQILGVVGTLARRP